MKLLVLATAPVGADDVRSALPDADLEGSEVLASVGPATAPIATPATVAARTPGYELIS